MPALTPTLCDRLRAQLADLKMPGALEALDEILHRTDAGQLAAGEAMATRATAACPDESGLYSCVGDTSSAPCHPGGGGGGFFIAIASSPRR